ncbi:peroxide stress protein YaaA [Nostocoides sp. F2B08]|uniref:YaaA family protein n=1 Tax=Nostocoides sp. F2B08 TaxID=2653936 RepID=UPI001263A40D|nr:peroxide stress protein YaaA [Tetrasphaera sp. F2B08]KAB7744679.1 peroxide stress protein YaaA [Tetrasphaera sp. F2B08]
MLILLPPSESKSGRRRGRPVDPSSWSFPELAGQRSTVAAALAAVSGSLDAPRLLGVSPNLLDEIARNLDLATAPAMPAREVYTGVLYDALDVATLSPAAKRRANRWVVVVSALYGAIRLGDAIAPYRLAMGVDLPGVGPLAKAWRPHLEAVLPPAVGRGCIVDCRSSAYVSAWTPGPELSDRWAAVTVPGASHMAKHTRGLVARQLLVAGADPRSVPALAEVLRHRFQVDLTVPARSGRPWTLAVSDR